MAGRIDARLKELGIELPTLREARVAKILPYTMANGFLFLSGQVPQWNGEIRYVGKLGREFGTAEGQQAARLSMLNVIAAAKQALGGDLDRVEQVMKVVGMVNCVGHFIEVPHVVNGASEVCIDIFGDKGRHARSAVGMASMPFDVAIEVEAVFLVK